MNFSWQRLKTWQKVLIVVIGLIILANILPKETFVNLFTVAIFAILLLPIIRLIIKNIRAKMMIRCPNCKYEGVGKRITKGSFGVELILWILLIIPGLIYSVWRISNKKWVCPQCDFENVVKIGIVNNKP